MIPYKDLHPSKHFPWGTVLLISLNLGVFLYQVLLPETLGVQFIYKYSVIPFEFKVGHNIGISPDFPFILSIYTAMFLHGGWLHLIGNMLYLWIFGDNVEDRMGSIRFLLFYLFCGTVATIAQIYAGLDSKIPALGASGAIAGILAAYLRLFPKARIGVLVPIFFFLRTFILPAWAVLGFWLLLQIVQVQSAGPKATGGVAYFAHLGGFITGLLLTPIFLPKTKKGRK